MLKTTSQARVRPQQAGNRRASLAIVALLLLAVALIYWRVWEFGFIFWDDPSYVSQNPHVMTGITPGNLAWSVTTFHAGFWIPLTWISFMCDAAVYGAHAGGYHVTNVLLHAANMLLLFAFLEKSTGNRARSALVAALFAIHPLRVESVAWITERKDVLSTMFGLLALLSYAASATSRRRAWLAVSFLCFIASLSAKPALVTLPFVFLLIDFWPLGRFERNGGLRSAAVPLLVEKSPFFLVSAVFSVLTYVAQRNSGAVEPLDRYPLGARLAAATVSYVTYLRKTFVPNDLAVFYPHVFHPAWAVALAAALLLTLSVASLIRWRRDPYWTVGWFWYLGTLFPMIGLVQAGKQELADRFSYFPSIGVYVACVWLAAERVPAGLWRSRVLPAATIAALCALGAMSYLQVSYWRNDVSLFRHARSCGYDSPLVRSFLGSALVRGGDADEGLPLLESAVELDPDDADIHFNLGVGLQTLGRFEAAVKQYESTLTLSERDAGAHYNMGMILLARRENAAAKRHFRRTVELAPDNIDAYVNLAKISLATGEFSEALAHSQRAVDLDPRSIGGRHNLALALLALGRLDDAILQFRYLTQLLPNDRDAQQNLERALAMKRNPRAH